MPASRPLPARFWEKVGDPEFTPTNTYTQPSGWRECRTCKRNHDRAYRARKRLRSRTGLHTEDD